MLIEMEHWHAKGFTARMVQLFHKSPVVRQRGISKRVFQENKAHQIFRKTNIYYPLIHTRTCAYQGVRNVGFPKNLAGFVFLKHLWPPCNVSKNTCPLVIFEQIFYLLLVTFLLPFFTIILANMCKVKKRMNLHTSLQILGVVEAWRYLHGWSNFSRFTFSFSH